MRVVPLNVSVEVLEKLFTGKDVDRAILAIVTLGLRIDRAAENELMVMLGDCAVLRLVFDDVPG